MEDDESLAIKVDESLEVTVQSFQVSVGSLPDRVDESVASNADESFAGIVVVLLEVVVIDVSEGEEFEEVQSLLGKPAKEGEKERLLSVSSFSVGLSRGSSTAGMEALPRATVFAKVTVVTPVREAKQSLRFGWHSVIVT